MAKKKQVLDADDDVDVSSDGFHEEFCIKPQYAIDEDGIEYQVSSGIDKNGREIPDPDPIELPIGYSHPPSLAEMMARMLHNQRYMDAQRAAGEETIEEAGDFDLDDDDELLDLPTGYEILEELALDQAKRKAPKADPQALNPPASSKPQTSEAVGGGSGGGQPTPPPPLNPLNRLVRLPSYVLV